MLNSILSAATALLANERTAWIGHVALCVAFVAAFALTSRLDVQE